MQCRFADGNSGVCAHFSLHRKGDKGNTIFGFARIRPRNTIERTFPKRKCQVSRETRLPNSDPIGS